MAGTAVVAVTLNTDLAHSLNDLQCTIQTACLAQEKCDVRCFADTATLALRRYHHHLWYHTPDSVAVTTQHAMPNTVQIREATRLVHGS